MSFILKKIIFQGQEYSSIDLNQIGEEIALTSENYYREMLNNRIHPENLIVFDGNLHSLQDFDLLVGTGIEFMITQGIKASTDSTESKEKTTCLVRAKISNPGNLGEFDNFRIQPKVFQVHIITLSDRAYRKEYSDRTGPLIKEQVEVAFEDWNHACEIHNHLLPDDENHLQLLLDGLLERTDLLITTGGTGVGPRDISVDVIAPLLDFEIPGIMEVIRVKYGTENPHAMLSRGVAGMKGNCQVYTLPGSPKAVKEYLEVILKTMNHLFYMRYGIDTH